MQGGDISNEVIPRLLVVFEGLLGLPPEQEERKHRLFGRRNTGTSIDQYQVNDALGRRIWDIVWRKGYAVDVVTFLGDSAVDPIKSWLDRHELPVGNVLSTTPGNLARSLAYRPHIAAVYDPEPSRRFTYGSKGYIMDPEAPDFFGTF